MGGPDQEEENDFSQFFFKLCHKERKIREKFSNEKIHEKIFSILF